MKFLDAHLAYCTNIHPAESWEETEIMLRTHVLGVRDRLRSQGLLAAGEWYGIGLRLSARAARELLTGDLLDQFRRWLEQEACYVFTINGFPYGDFHGTRVKEQVFRPDWTERARLDYTKDLFRILAGIARRGTGASVSTLPGSHKSFQADESRIIEHLVELADWLDELAQETGHDFHLGLEPEPLGHFENTEETLRFFHQLRAAAGENDSVSRRIGLNYDSCHFALEYEHADPSLDRLVNAGIRISKIHLSSALALDPRDPAAVAAVREFDEPVYFHQVLLRDHHGDVKRYEDLPAFSQATAAGELRVHDYAEMRVHFHIPLDAEPQPPLRSTLHETRKVIQWLMRNPHACAHYEIETYTWGVLPSLLRRPVDEQIAGEYGWVMKQVGEV